MKIRIILKIRIIPVILAVLIIPVISCVAPEEWHDAYDDSIVPEPVSNVKVENVSGGAIISYTLPSNVPEEELLGAKIAYSFSDEGEIMERWTSVDKDTIVLEGYGDTNERTVTIYAVHKNRNVSVGVPVNIKPLTPPISLIRKSMKVLSAYGGIQILWDNPMRKDMGVALYVEDSITHEMMLFDKYFSNGVYGKTNFRHFDTKEHNFHIEMFDRWQNYAQPLDTTLTPLHEIEIMGNDGRGNAIWTLFDDGRVIQGNNTTPWRWIYRCDIHNNELASDARTRIFNIVALKYDHYQNPWWEPGYTLTLDYFFPGEGDRTLPFPLYVTFDMGRKAVYSRMKLVGRYSGTSPFVSPVPVDFDVWGTNNPKTIEEVEDPHGIYEKGSKEANQAYWSSWKIANGTDEWKKDWVKLSSNKFFMSYGGNQYYTGVPLSAEDVYQSINGIDYDFNMDIAEPFRYLRWEIHMTSTNQNRFSCAGLKYWGSYVD